MSRADVIEMEAAGLASPKGDAAPLKAAKKDEKGAEGGAPRVLGDSPKLDPGKASAVKKAGIAAAVVGVALGGAGFAADAHRFAFSYLTGFAWVATIGLGALFFVLIQHLTKAGWSVVARRQMEWVASGVLPACIVLFLPVAAFAHTLFPWLGHEAHDEAIQKKAAYLNPTFFFIRAAIFLGAWTLLSVWFAKKSADQDASGDKKITNKLTAVAAPSMYLFALSLTFAGFDWLMSLDPKWFSTIFGVYIFAGAAVSSMALLSLMTIRLQTSGVFKRVSNVEHRHDIGKLFFAFIVFWAYIGFSQYFLIWYANIPEETVWFRHRWLHGWNVVSMLLFLGHFVVPFVVLLSRHAKRSVPVLGVSAAWMLFMHWIDMYWLVMPNVSEELAFSWIDVAGWLAPAGIAVLAVTMRATSGNLYPTSDPRLPESLKLENL